jgi:nucleotide-binding universal stress UspA family protein
MQEFTRLRTVLVASDFSDRSRLAEAHALALAEAFGASLLLVNAIEPIMGVDEGDVDADEFDEFYERLQERADSEIEKRLGEWEGRNVIVKHHVQIGHRWQVILEQAEAHDVDLVVLGRRTYAPDQKVVLGTTSQKVFFGSSRPVLFVPGES